MMELVKNRIFTINAIAQLRSVGSALLNIGHHARIEWIDCIDQLEYINSRVPGSIKSAKLVNSVEAMKTQIVSEQSMDGYLDYEELALSLSHTMGKLAENVPACDADAAQATEMASIAGQTGIQMIQELKNYIDVAVVDHDYLIETNELLDYILSWQETRTGIDEVMEYARTLLKGLPSYVEFYGDPVNMTTGNFTYSYTDLEVKGALPLKFVRFYNAMDKNDGSMGRGWIHNWETRLLIQENALTLIHEDGREEVFDRKDETTYESSRGGQAQIRLYREAWCWRREDGLTVVFDREGKMTCLLNDALSGIVLLYEEGQLKKVQADTGDYFSFSYNGRGQLVQVADHSGREIRFTYDKKKLTEVTDPEGQTMRYSYGKNGRIDRIIDKRNVAVLENSYDGHRRITAQTFPDGGVMKFES